MPQRTGTPPPDDLQLAFPDEPLPDDTYAGVDQADQNTDEWWRDCADRAIAQLARTKRPFTTDALHDLVPTPDHPNRVGAAIRRAYTAGVIVPTGRALPSTTASRRGGLVREWIGAEVNDGVNPGNGVAA